MKILIADDDPRICRMLDSMLTNWGYEVLVANDGNAAWQVLQQDNSPPLAILDWVMPGMDGITICQEARRIVNSRPLYLILLTGINDPEGVIKGLRAGADDYITKPFSVEELQARIQVGVRMVTLQLALAERAEQLESALAHVKRLEGLLPICSYCKRICDDQKYWHQIEVYISEHSEAEFSHVICPDCNERIVKPEIERLRGQRKVRAIRQRDHKKK